MPDGKKWTKSYVRVCAVWYEAAHEYQGAWWVWNCNNIGDDDQGKREGLESSIRLHDILNEKLDGQWDPMRRKWNEERREKGFIFRSELISSKINYLVIKLWPVMLRTKWDWQKDEREAEEVRMRSWAWFWCELGCWYVWRGCLMWEDSGSQKQEGQWVVNVNN